MTLIYKNTCHGNYAKKLLELHEGAHYYFFIVIYQTPIRIVSLEVSKQINNVSNVFVSGEVG